MTEISAFTPWQPHILPMAVYLFMLLVLFAMILLMTRSLGVKKGGTAKESPYECGILPGSSARMPYPAPFYLIAVFFLIFDVEGAFIFSWAVAVKDLGWWGWFEITFFIFVLLMSLIYLWQKKGLDWQSATTGDTDTDGNKRHGTHAV